MAAAILAAIAWSHRVAVDALSAQSNEREFSVALYRNGAAQPSVTGYHWWTKGIA